MTPLELKEQLSYGKALLGLDFGEKTIGLALSDLTLIIASPYKTIKRTSINKDIYELIDVIKELNIGGLVFGLPKMMSGLEGERAAKTRKFASRLQAKIDIPITFWDERFSSAAVERIMIQEADLSRKKRKKNIDKAAAAYILQGFLDFIALAKL